MQYSRTTTISFVAEIYTKDQLIELAQQRTIARLGVDVIIAIVQYRYFRAVALESHPRLRIERRRVRARRRY